MPEESPLAAETPTGSPLRRISWARIAAAGGLVLFWTALLLALGAGAGALAIPVVACAFAAGVLARELWPSNLAQRVVARAARHARRVASATGRGLVAAARWIRRVARSVPPALARASAWLRPVVARVSARTVTAAGSVRPAVAGAGASLRPAVARVSRGTATVAASTARVSRRTGARSTRAAHVGLVGANTAVRRRLGPTSGLVVARVRSAASNLIPRVETQLRTQLRADPRDAVTASRRAAWELNRAAAEHRREGRIDEAIEACERALAIVKDLNDRREEALTLNSLGLALGRRGDPELASACFERSASIFHELESRHLEGQVLANLGTLREQQERPDEAVQCWREALACLDGGSAERDRVAVHLAQRAPDEAPAG